MKDQTVSLDINGKISKVILSTRSEGLDQPQTEKKKKITVAKLLKPI